MKKILISLLLSTLIKTITAQSTIIPSYIIDGDTFKAGNLTYRIMSIDAPELNQPHGKQSKNKLDSLIKLKPINITTQEKDAYGRILCKPTINGKRIDSILIRNGTAWHYKEFNNETMLKQMQIYAQQNKIGLWKDNCKPALYPPEFRKLKAKTKKIYIEATNCP